MKSAFLLSHDPSLIPKVNQSIRAAGTAGWEGCDVVYAGTNEIQVVESGTDRLFTLEPYLDRPDLAWTYRTPPHFPEPRVPMPDLDTVLAYGVLCRWEDLFVRLVRAVAEISGEPAWILDENSVIWDALNVDPARVHL